MIGEIHDIAGQHEVIVENLTSVILRDIQLLVQQVKQDRKKVGESFAGSLFKFRHKLFISIIYFCIFEGHVFVGWTLPSHAT